MRGGGWLWAIVGGERRVYNISLYDDLDQQWDNPTGRLSAGRGTRKSAVSTN